MKWSSKITCIIVFLTSLLLIFSMGRVNVRYFSEVKKSVEDIYKDRLVVNGMIIELQQLLHQKELAIVSEDSLFWERTNSSINLQLEELIREFRETYLTNLESETLDRFSSGIKKLKDLEGKVFFENKKMNDFIKKSLLENLSSLKIDLKTLSSIQLAEGKRKLYISDKAVEEMKLHQTIENYAILVIGILIIITILIP